MKRRGLLLGLLVLGGSSCTIGARVGVVGDAGGPGDAAEARFSTLRAGAALPDEASCTARVRRSSWEPRPENAAANRVLATPAQLAALSAWDAAHGYDDRALALQARITGSFVGTTDETLQWIACKWGFDEDLVRAEATEASNWTQGARSDWILRAGGACPPDADTRQGPTGDQCATTYGLFQITWQFYKSAWPAFRDSTSFNADYAFGLLRACFEGLETDQAKRAPAGIAYRADDEWGCLGAYFSGNWYDSGANNYIANVKSWLAVRPWAQPGF